jgi:uncharacterized protein
LWQLRHNTAFSPEFMEVRAPEYDDFVVGNILDNDLEDLALTDNFQRINDHVARGVSACKAGCLYFGVCGGGSPVNKYCEQGNLGGTETEFCRLSTQAAADALNSFLTTKLDGRVPESSSFKLEMDGARSVE